MKPILIALLAGLCWAGDVHMILDRGKVNPGVVFPDIITSSSPYLDLRGGRLDILGTRTVLTPHISGKGLEFFTTFNADAGPRWYSPGACDQTPPDWSGNGVVVTLGSDGLPGGDTNDPDCTTATSRNLLAPGSTDDFAHAAWSLTGTPITTSTSVEDDDAASFENIYQDLAITDGQALVCQYWVNKTSSASTFPGLVCDGSIGDATADRAHISLNTDTGTWAWRATYGVNISVAPTVTEDGSYWHVVLVDDADNNPSSARYLIQAAVNNDGSDTWDVNGVGVVALLKAQAEIGSSASTYTNPAEESVVKGGEFTTDDYVTADGIAGGFSGEDVPLTVGILFRTDDLVAARTLFSLGNSADNNPVLSLRVHTDGTLKAFIRDDAATGALDRTTTETASPGQWHVFVLSTTGTVLSGYFDGAAVTWNNSGFDVGVANFDQATIGAYRRITVAQYWEGSIGPIPVWSRALPVGEILRVTNQIAKQSCIHRGIAEMCAVANRTAPAIGWNWGGDSWLLALNPALHADQRYIDVGAQVAAGEAWDRAHVEVVR